MTEALRASRKNRNREPWKIGGWGDLEVRDSRVSKEPSLNKLPNSRDRENIEPTSIMKTGHQFKLLNKGNDLILKVDLENLIKCSTSL